MPVGNKRACRLRLLALVLAMLLLCGCAPETAPLPSSTAPTEPSQTTSPPPSQTEPEVTKPDPLPLPLPELEALTYLRCTEFDVFPQLLSLGDGRVVASRNTYNAVQGIIHCLEIIDIYNDKVLAKTVKGNTMELVEQQFPDGAILMAEPDSGKFYVYDQNLTVKRSFTAPNLDGFFTYDRSGYYFVQDSILCRMDVATGQISPVTLDRRLRLESLLSVHPDKERLVARVYVSDHSTTCAVAVIDGDTGTVLLLRDDLTHVWLTDDSFFGVEMNADALSYDVYYGDLTGGQVQMIPTEQLYASSVSYAAIPGTRYLLWKLAPDTGDRATKIYDLANGATVADLGQTGLYSAVFSTIYLKQEQLLMGYYSIKEEVEEGSTVPPKETFHPVLIDPAKLSFVDGAAPETAPWQNPVDDTAVQSSHVTLPDALTEVGALADALEKKYGIEILVGQQTVPVCSHSGYQVATNEDPEQIKGALEVLDGALAMYPQGFAGQFRNGAGEGGLSICLTGKITGGLPATGFARACRDKYELVLDITAFEELDRTIHHELWHAVEMYLSTDTFDTEAWTACNPEGFTYYGHYNSGYLQLTQWTYTSGAGSNSYFVSPYGRINGREDRACIMEDVMTGFGDTLRTMPALQSKLRIMAQAIRDGFDTTGWTDVWWEQYL